MCGLSAGASLGALLLLLVFMLSWVPLEVDSLSALLRLEAQLDADGSRDEQPLDAWGNAINYERSGPGQGYTLRSLGPDGIAWNGDDLCVHGHTKDLPLRGRPAVAADFQRALSSGRLAWGDRLEALRKKRCSGSLRLSAR